MSYVPATFTAGVALVLTAAGAVGGQYLAGVRESLADRAATPVALSTAQPPDPPTDADASTDTSESGPPTGPVERVAPTKLRDVTMGKIRWSIDDLRQMVKGESRQTKPASAAKMDSLKTGVLAE